MQEGGIVYEEFFNIDNILGILVIVLEDNYKKREVKTSLFEYAKQSKLQELTSASFTTFRVV